MFNNVALDVVIGLVFVYLLYSLLGTLLQEIIATNIGLRGCLLQMAIRRMLDDDKEVHNRANKALSQHIKHIKEILKDKNISDDRAHMLKRKLDNLQTAQDLLDDDHNAASPKLSEVFYSHPLIKYLSANTLLLKNKPSYIDPETFSKVVVDLLRGDNVQAGSSDRQPIQQSLDSAQIAWTTGVHIETETLIYLRSIWADAQGDITKFKANLKQWFNEMMDRTTGWYKKYTQIILMIIGLFIAISFNVDTISIVKTLQNNPAIRDQVLAQANAFSKAHPDLDAQIAKNEKIVSQINSPKLDSLKQLHDKLYKQATDLVGKDIGDVNNVLAIGLNSSNYHWFSPFGWILTALAISMGAPFWFDLLNKLMQLRGSIAPKEDKKPKSGSVSAPLKRVG